MSIEIEEYSIYTPRCNDCNWEGADWDSMSAAEEEADEHEAEHEGDQDADPRTEREKFQDAMDFAARGGHLE